MRLVVLYFVHIIRTYGYLCDAHTYVCMIIVYIVHNIVQAASLLLQVLKKDYNLLQHISNIQVQVNNMIYYYVCKSDGTYVCTYL